MLQPRPSAAVDAGVDGGPLVNQRPRMPPQRCGFHAPRTQRSHPTFRRLLRQLGVAAEHRTSSKKSGSGRTV